MHDMCIIQFKEMYDFKMGSWPRTNRPQLARVYFCCGLKTGKQTWNTSKKMKIQ